VLNSTFKLMNTYKLLQVFNRFFFIAGATKLIFLYLGQISCSILEALCLVLMPIGISRFLQGSNLTNTQESAGLFDALSVTQISLLLVITSCAYAAVKFLLVDYSIKYSEDLAASLTLDVSKYLFCQSPIRSSRDRGQDSQDKLLNSIISCIPDVFRSAYWSSLDIVSSTSFLVVVFIVSARIFGLLSSLAILVLVFSLFCIINIPARKLKNNNALINDLKSSLLSSILASASGYREINYSNSFSYYQQNLRANVLALRRTESVNLRVVQHLNSLSSALPFLLVSLILLLPLPFGVPIEVAIFLVFSIQRLIPTFSRFSSSYIKFFSTASSVNILYKLIRSLDLVTDCLYVTSPNSITSDSALQKTDIPKIVDKLFYQSIDDVGLRIECETSSLPIFTPNNLVQITGSSGLGKSYLLDRFSTNLIKYPESHLFRIFYLPTSFVIYGQTALDFIFAFSTPVPPQVLNPYLIGFKLIDNLSDADSFLSSHPSFFSSGQLTRLAIIRALLSRPSVLLLDESLSTLNYEIELCVLNTIFHHHPSIVLVSVTHRPLHPSTQSNYNVFNIRLYK